MASVRSAVFLLMGAGIIEAQFASAAPSLPFLSGPELRVPRTKALKAHCTPMLFEELAETPTPNVLHKRLRSQGMNLTAAVLEKIIKRAPFVLTTDESIYQLSQALPGGTPPYLVLEPDLGLANNESLVLRRLVFSIRGTWPRPDDDLASELARALDQLPPSRIFFDLTQYQNPAPAIKIIEGLAKSITSKKRLHALTVRCRKVDVFDSLSNLDRLPVDRSLPLQPAIIDSDLESPLPRLHVSSPSWLLSRDTAVFEKDGFQNTLTFGDGSVVRYRGLRDAEPISHRVIVAQKNDDATDNIQWFFRNDGSLKLTDYLEPQVRGSSTLYVEYMKKHPHLVMSPAALGNKVIVDIGSGVGSRVKAMNDVLASWGFERSVYGLDPVLSPEQLQDKHFIRGLAWAIPVKDESVDVINVTDGFLDGDLPAATLIVTFREWKRALKKRGFFQVSPINLKNEESLRAELEGLGFEVLIDHNPNSLRAYKKLSSTAR